MNEWVGKIAIVTGGSSGIGKATAARFLKEGATVYIVGLPDSKLQVAKEELAAAGGKVDAIGIDLNKVEDCEKVINTVYKAEGKIDQLVNAAGVYFTGPTVDMTERIWDLTLGTNLKGMFFMCKFAIPKLIESEGGIVNVSSDAGLIGNNNSAVYCASKGGVTLLTKSLAIELAPRKVRVNCVCPGVTDTPLIEADFKRSPFTDRKEYDRDQLHHYPQGEHVRYIKTEEIAECIYFLSQKNKVEPISGAALSVDFAITAGY